MLSAQGGLYDGHHFRQQFTAAKGDMIEAIVTQASRDAL